VERVAASVLLQGLPMVVANLLEMVHPRASPEHGVSCHACDQTQGAACAVAAGVAVFLGVVEAGNAAHARDWPGASTEGGADQGCAAVAIAP
jgi:hypothetical protein